MSCKLDALGRRYLKNKLCSYFWDTLYIGIHHNPNEDLMQILWIKRICTSITLYITIMRENQLEHSITEQIDHRTYVILEKKLSESLIEQAALSPFWDRQLFLDSTVNFCRRRTRCISSFVQTFCQDSLLIDIPNLAHGEIGILEYIQLNK